jgi:hypothetical protein
MVFAKNEQTNLTAGQKVMIRNVLREIEAELVRRN